MSAIFGIIKKKQGLVNLDSMNTMMSAIKHRAVDGNNIWINENVGFGHCLLKTFTQQEIEKQPLKLHSCTITADVRLDNREQLASLLKINKESLNETSDPEIIILAYKRWGEECVNYLDGEFAFVIWDSEKYKVFAAVDKIGFRPLFYYDSPDLFIFCSEIKGIVAAKPNPNYFNEESLIEYFDRKGIPNNTFNREIFSLCGGNVLTLHNETLTVRKYWNLTKSGKFSFKKDDDWYECARELIFNAIEKRLNPDSITGITLSGGLDSTSIACILSEILKKRNKPLYAFSSVLPIDYQGAERDEREYIEIVGKHCSNIIQTYVEAPGVSPYSNLEEAFKIDESFPNAFFYMDKALLESAKSMNMKSLFTGFGGDFWISWKGDTVFYELINSGKLLKAATVLQELSKEDNQSLYTIFRNNYLVKNKLAQNLIKVINHKKNEYLNDNLLIINYKKRGDSFHNYYHLMHAMVNNGRIGRIAGMLANRNSYYLCDSMIPFFDVDLMNFLADAPIHLHIRNGVRRSILREAMKGAIPSEIYNRKDKMPYSPDFKKRITIESEMYKNLLKSSKNDMFIQKYIDIEKTIMLVDMVINGKAQESNKLIYNFVARSIIAQFLLNKIKENNYIF